MFKKCQVVCLPTNEKAPLQLGVNFHRNISDFRETYFNLHILSDDVVDINDHVVANFLLGKKVLKCTNDIFKHNCKESPDMFKKIIASTDPSLNLPSPSPEDLEEWCKTQPKEVMIKHEPRSYKMGIIWLPQINRDNQVSIKFVEKTYSTEEVIAIIEKVMSEATSCGHFDAPESFL